MERETAEQLGFMAERMGVSRSALVRDIVTEPVAIMAEWVRSVPDDLTPAKLQRLHDRMTRDVEGLARRRGSGRG